VPTIVDLGCGQEKAVPEAIGIDIVPTKGVDIAGRADAIPLGSSSVDEVYASHLLEHVPNLAAVMEEIWRICRDGALVRVWCPHYSAGLYVWGDPTHLRAMSSITFDYWDPDSGMNYYFDRARFTVETRRLNLFFTREQGRSRFGSATGGGRAKRVLARVAGRLANASRMAQLLCERVWAGWIGFEEVYFELRCVKASDSGRP
jgi:hypothetical protein